MRKIGLHTENKSTNIENTCLATEVVGDIENKTYRNSRNNRRNMPGESGWRNKMVQNKGLLGTCKTELSKTVTEMFPT